MIIKVLQLNMWMGRCFDQALNFFIHTQPDIILLQEVPSGLTGLHPKAKTDSYQVLTAQLPHQSRYTPCWSAGSDHQQWHLGLAIFSRFPIIKSTSQFYHQSQQILNHDLVGAYRFPGNLLTVEVQINQQSLTIATTHFLWSLHPQITSEQQLALPNLLTALKPFQPIILGGDFNIAPDSSIYTTLTHHFSDDRPIDNHNTLHPTIHQLKGSKSLAVDYLFHRGDSIKSISSSVPVVDVSDHLPVLVEYDFPV